MDDPNMHAYGEDGPTDADIGRQWRENSSLEKWFPITAERLAAKERENLHLAREARTWWEAAQTYAADAERLREALRAVLAWGTDENYERAKVACDTARALVGPNGPGEPA